MTARWSGARSSLAIESCILSQPHTHTESGSESAAQSALKQLHNVGVRVCVCHSRYVTNCNFCRVRERLVKFEVRSGARCKLIVLFTAKGVTPPIVEQLQSVIFGWQCAQLILFFQSRSCAVKFKPHLGWWGLHIYLKRPAQREFSNSVTTAFFVAVTVAKVQCSTLSGQIATARVLLVSELVGDRQRSNTVEKSIFRYFDVQQSTQTEMASWFPGVCVTIWRLSVYWKSFTYFRKKRLRVETEKLSVLKNQTR